MSNIKMWYLHKVMKYQWLEASELEEITGSSSEIKYAEVQKGDARHTLADVGLAKELIGYEPVINIGKGLKRFVGCFQGDQITVSKQ